MRAAAIPIDRPGPADLAPTRGDDPEVVRLHRLLDGQPNCLLRLGMDSLILAANDAALSQVAARELGQVWGHPFTERISLDHRDRWSGFATRVREDGAASIEFNLLDLDGNTYSVLLNGVRQPAHPDGIESMIVALRDLSGLKRLERALQSQADVWQALTDTRNRLDEVAAHRKRLLEALAERDAELAKMAAGHTADLARIQALAEEHQLELLLRDRQWQQQIDGLRREIEDALMATTRAHRMVTGADPGVVMPPTRS